MKPISKKKKRIRRVAAILFVLCAGFCYWSNNSIQITNYTYISEEVPEGFDGYTIVQLSDLHNKKFLNDNASLLKKVKALQPDLIVLTGDIVDNSHHTNIDKAVLFTNQVQQIAQTYYITGNHEVSLKRKEYLDFIKRMKAGGVVYLKDEIVHLKSESGETISLIGLADDSLLSPKLEEIMRGEPEEGLSVLLAHEPQFINFYAETGVDIVFSGHAHGGQFRIPFLHRGLYAPDQGLFPTLTEGSVTRDSTTMYISRGLGNSAFPQRLMNRPEIVCVRLSCS